MDAKSDEALLPLFRESQICDSSRCSEKIEWKTKLCMSSDRGERGPGRHFLSLGSSFPIPPQKPPFGAFPPPTLSSSFVAPNPVPPVSHLPDIYTTCPELRKFTPLFSLPVREPEPPPPPPVPRFPVPVHFQMFHMFDPNAPIIRPFVLLPPPERSADHSD
jgi:hypothetical protein